MTDQELHELISGGQAWNETLAHEWAGAIKMNCVRAALKVLFTTHEDSVTMVGAGADLTNDEGVKQAIAAQSTARGLMKAITILTDLVPEKEEPNE